MAGARMRAVLVAVVLIALGVGAASVGVFGSGRSQGAAAPAPVQPTTPLAERPNIVVVMADDMRADDLIFAPNLRTLVAEQGAAFQNSFAPYPLCCPSRASFLTGQLAHNHKVWSQRKPYGYQVFDDSATLATAIHNEGYQTGFVGKYLNGYGPDSSKVSGGPSYEFEPPGWDSWAGGLMSSPAYKGSIYDYYRSIYNHNGKLELHPGEYSSDVINDYATDMVDQFSGEDPFFLYVNYVAPHSGLPVEKDDPRVRHAGGRKSMVFPTAARPGYIRGEWDKLIDRPKGVPRTGGPAEADVSDKPWFFRRLPELDAQTRANLTEVTRQRAEAITVMDMRIGEMIAQLKAKGEWDNTVFVFTSDNGYFLGEHRQLTGKSKAHEPSLRVPLLITGPGLREERTISDPATTVDLTATLLELAGAQAPHPPDGQSLVPALTGAEEGWQRPVINEALDLVQAGQPTFGDPRSSIGIRTARYSYIRYSNGETELYDLQVDAAEMENKHGDPQYADIEALLAAQWDRYRDCADESCREPLPPELVTSAEETKTLADQYWADITELYGWH